MQSTRHSPRAKSQVLLLDKATGRGLRGPVLSRTGARGVLTCVLPNGIAHVTRFSEIRRGAMLCVTGMIAKQSNHISAIQQSPSQLRIESSLFVPHSSPWEDHAVVGFAFSFALALALPLAIFLALAISLALVDTSSDVYIACEARPIGVGFTSIGVCCVGVWVLVLGITDGRCTSWQM